MTKIMDCSFGKLSDYTFDREAEIAKFSKSTVVAHKQLVIQWYNQKQQYISKPNMTKIDYWYA